MTTASYCAASNSACRTSGPKRLSASDTNRSWLLASLGVLLRDIGQVTSVLSTVLLLVSPIFFPIARLPEGMRAFVYLNPLSVIVDQVRAVVLFGELPDWQALGIYTLVALAVAQLGYWWFQRTRRGFADAL